MTSVEIKIYKVIGLHASNGIILLSQAGSLESYYLIYLTLTDSRSIDAISKLYNSFTSSYYMK